MIGMSEPAVEVVDLVKRYPKRPTNAVDGVDFQVQPGDIFGLLGPNGAGKTTTIGILTTRVVPSAGIARVRGVDVTENPVLARSMLSVVPQRPNLDHALNARQILLFHAAYHGVDAAERNRRADALLEQFGLADRGGDKVHQFSGGMTQRLLVARALMHAPDVIFLDEPSTGLDPQARLFVWDKIRELRTAGITIVLTTHDMDEAATLADRVGIMDYGKLLALDTPQALTRSLPGSSTLDLTIQHNESDTAEAMVTALAGIGGVERVEQVASTSAGQPPGPIGLLPGRDGRAPMKSPVGPNPESTDEPHALRVRLYCTGDAARLIGPATRVLTVREASLSALAIGEPSLEDVFIHLTGRDLR
jgi:ABC-2 type transport system ATP-binding protein